MLKATLSREKVKITTNKKGITLIALVVTIIVLLILAGISIMMLTGQNGILSRAAESKEKTEKASVEEQRLMAMLEATSNIENTTFQGITIPAGFAPTKIEGESTIDEGLVIIDSDGNEFVWIPADGVKLKYEQNIELGGDHESYAKYDNWSDEKINEKITSVNKYKGFYVGRYEVGVEESKEYRDNSTYIANKETRNTNKGKISIKKGLQPWNFISWENAKKLSEQMYSYNNVSQNVTSYLIDSYAWDTITTWLGNSGFDIDDSSSWGNFLYAGGYEINGLYSIGKRDFTPPGSSTSPTKYYRGNFLVPKGRKNEGNQDIIELATGISERNKAKNIYDFAGNLYEWTTEKNENGYAVRRGCCADSSIASVALRLATMKTDDYGCGYLNGFRVVLYLK